MSRKIDLFDVDKNWDQVVPHLNSPRVLRALDSGMKLWCGERRSSWDPAQGPHYYSRAADWRDIACDALIESQELADLDREYAEMLMDDFNGTIEEYERRLCAIESQFYPQPNTPDWYRCWGACHSLAVWHAAVGSLVLPGLEWHVVRAEHHSTALGIGRRNVIFDILWDADAWATRGVDFVWSATWCAIDRELVSQEDFVKRIARQDFRSKRNRKSKPKSKSKVILTP